MRHSRFESTFIAAAAVVLLAGCATAPAGVPVVDGPAALPPIQKQDAAVLSQLSIGMPLSEFRKIVPQAFVAGQSGKTTAYELDDLQKFVTKSDIDRQDLIWGAGSPGAHTFKQVLWFYFYESRLVKWGRPQDWPPHPELIVKGIAG